MKRTAHARLVATGTVDPSPAVVDKHGTWGSVYATDVVDRDLAGVAAGIDCEACGVRLQPEPSARHAWGRHVATTYHQRNAAVTA